MNICIVDIPEKGLNVDFVENVSYFPVLSEMITNGEFKFLSPIKINTQIRLIHKMIEVIGKFEVDVNLTCSRCLKEFITLLSSDFTLTYAHEPIEIFDEDEKKDIELSALELDLIPFDGKDIDLKESIQEEIVMSLPFKSLCSKGCKGLCPNCGADLNEGECNCKKNSFNPQFAALKNLRIKE